MIKAAVLGSPISHSLSPLLHRTAYSILGIEGDYRSVEIKEDQLLPFLESALTEQWSGFNLTMPLKEQVFSSKFVQCDEISSRIRSANTLWRSGDLFLATSTDTTAFSRLLSDRKVDRVAIIGGGGTARAAVGALAERAVEVDLLLRTPGRLDAIQSIAPNISFTLKGMDSSLAGYDLVINTSPAGAADHLAPRVDQVTGLLFESLYKPWPTELAFAWSESGGETLNGLDLLVEQALDGIELMTGVSIDYRHMRSELLKVALEAISPH
jgi:shikimate dehydrogenase